MAWLDGFLCPRRKVCSGRLLLVGGSIPAHLPAREGTAPVGCAGEAHCEGWEQQKWERRGERYLALPNHFYFRLFHPVSLVLTIHFKVLSHMLLRL